MKPIFRDAGPIIAALVAAVALSGCAGSQPAGQMGTTSGADAHRGMMDRGGTGGQMDMKSMCEMHNKVMGSKTSEERSAMMDDHMKSMSPETRQRHMEMMERQCK